MIKAVEGFMSENEASYQGNAPITAAITELNQTIGEINLVRALTLTKTSGLVSEKEQRQSDLIESTYKISSMIYAYAEHSGNEILRDSVDFPISELKKLRDGELTVHCNNILDLATSNAEGLAEYDITEETLNTLRDKITFYEEKLPARRLTISNRKTANSKLKSLIKDASNIITNQLDRLMVKYKTELPDFYSSYLNAREIVDYGTRYEKDDSNDGTPSPAAP